MIKLMLLKLIALLILGAMLHGCNGAPLTAPTDANESPSSGESLYPTGNVDGPNTRYANYPDSNVDGPVNR